MGRLQAEVREGQDLRGAVAGPGDVIVYSGGKVWSDPWLGLLETSWDRPVVSPPPS